MTDPISDMITRIRNAVSAKHTRVDLPASKLKAEIARILQDEGYIQGFRMAEEPAEREGRQPRQVIRLFLKYGPRGERVVGDSFLVAFNAYHESIDFMIPEGLYEDGWVVALDTSDDQIGIVSVFDDAPMLVAGVLSTAGFCILAWPVAELAPALRRVAWIDLPVAVGLLMVLGMRLRATIAA